VYLSTTRESNSCVDNSFPAFYRILSSITASTSSPLVPILSQITPVRTTTSYLHKSIFMVSTHLRLGLPSALFPSAIPPNNIHAFLFSVSATCRDHHIYRYIYILLVGKPEGKRPLGRPRRRWIDNIRMYLLDIRLSVGDWLGLAQDR
jgi:hypothetical protein